MNNAKVESSLYSGETNEVESHNMSKVKTRK